MKSTFDPQVNAVYVYLENIGTGEAKRSVSVAREGIILDFAADGRLLGIEILDARKHVPSLAVEPAQDDQLAQMAAQWCVRLTPEVDPEDPIPDPHRRTAAFLDWLRQSPAHVRAYLEIKAVENLVRKTLA